MILSNFFNKICVSLSLIKILLRSFLFLFKQTIMRVKLNSLIFRTLRINWLKSFHNDVALSISFRIWVWISELCWALQIKFNMVSIHQNIFLTGVVRITLLNSACSISRPLWSLSSFWLTLCLFKVSIFHFKNTYRSFLNFSFPFENLWGRILVILFLLLWFLGV